jgi:dihydroflavonol-4-reductase
MKTVGIIGGAGFIGSHVTQKFLAEGYQVKVSTTDITNAGKYEHLFALPNADNLTVEALNLRQANTVAGFVAGCELLVHSGTPFQLDVQDPQKELFEPTVNGTKNFLAALLTVTGLEKVVLVASVAGWNTAFPMNPPTVAPNHVFSEADTPYFGENDHPYAQAKFIADQVVRQFIAEHPDLPFGISTVSPTMVVGNSLSARQDSASMGLQYLFKHKIAPNPFVEMLFATDAAFAMVDVRDVAEAIFQAATRPNGHGRNYLISTETYTVSDIGRMLNQQPSLASGRVVYDNTLAAQELGIQFRPVQETLNQYV